MLPDIDPVAAEEATSDASVETSEAAKAKRKPSKPPPDPAAEAAARGKVTRPQRTSFSPQLNEFGLPMPRGPPLPRGAFSILEFCIAHDLSEAMYFKLKARGEGPAEMEIGRRRLISVEAAAAWRKRQTRKSRSAA